MQLGLKGKTALITGASKGIGKGIARGLAREGAGVAICARGAADLEAAAAEIRGETKADVLALPADCGKAEDLERFLRRSVDHFGGLDILVNNVATNSPHTVETGPDEAWHSLIELNLMAAVRCSRFVIPIMRARGGGRILNISSVSGKIPSPPIPLYSVTKAALIMFSRMLADEVAPANILVSCVNPGPTLTPLWELYAEARGRELGVAGRQIIDDYAKANIPLQRFANVEEIADFVVFLASERATFCTGSAYDVGGGIVRYIF